MEIKKENKFKKFFKRYGVLSLACVIALVVALSIGLSVPQEGEPVSNEDSNFGLPMKNALVVQDFDDMDYVYNDVLERYEMHLAIDFSSQDLDVFSVLAGTVSEVGVDDMDGNYVKISHENGFESVYSSMDEQINVKVGDKVSKGQAIGKASSSSVKEKFDGGHLHFTLLKNNVEIDPNLYLDLQNK